MVKSLAVITARAGSKRCPGKNLARIGGVSLVGWKTGRAIRSGVFSRVIVSTDDPAIAEEAARFGAGAPFLRPKNLARDGTPSDAVLSHALSWADAAGDAFDALVLLQPTTPFTPVNDYADGLARWRTTGSDLVFSTVSVSRFAAGLGPDGAADDLVARIANPERALPSAAPNGGLYIVSVPTFRRTQRIFHPSYRSVVLRSDRWSSLDIDTPDDLALARFAFDQGFVGAAPDAP